jgi:hypothetical protein
MPPRFSHPYGADHMDGHTVLGSNICAFFPVLLRVPNVFGLVNSQFFSFAQLIQGMYCVPFSGYILQIFCLVVVLVAVFMVDMAIRRAMAYERLRDHAVNSFVRVLSVHGQRNEQIAIPSASRHQNIPFGRFVRRAPKNLAYNRLANAYHWRNFSRAKTFLRHSLDQLYLIIRKRSLRQVYRAKATHLTFAADFVRILKSVHGLPSRHVNTPGS